MAEMIDGEVIAELYEALGLAGAQWMRASVELDQAAELDDLRAERDAWIDVLDKVPQLSRGKHDETCWKRHAGCLADRLLNGA